MRRNPNTVMGLLQSAGLMSANGFWTAPGNSIYVYKIICNQTGQYYIGQTENLKMRVYDHYNSVVTEACGGRIDSKPSQPWQTDTGQFLKSAYVPNKKQRLELFILKSLSVSVLAIAGEGDAANALEEFYISRSLIDPLCLNDCVQPYGKHRQPATSIPIEQVR